MPGRAAEGMATLECLIAVVVLALGVLGGSGTALLTLRSLREARLDSHAAIHARNRLELLVRQSRDPGLCFSLGGGTASHGDGVSERWQMTPTGHGFRVTLELSRGLPPRVDTLSTRIRCGA
ncbi:MAG TPA: hypothetical protein VNJ71_02305 [Gemmatimonadales bacterium]|jgi:hypothetical protein|nr:hypothetical protein [Gemmatimonadales bacterium]